MTHSINIACLLERDDLLVIAERACSELAHIASALQTGEGDQSTTEEENGISMAEVVEMEHDRHIERARNVLRSIMREFPQTVIKP